jgi:hypothetical protein
LCDSYVILCPAGSSMPYWLKFFTDAGIPPGEAANYAVTFTDHRIQSTMLTDLNKEYLTDMGIKCMGDIIAILKEAKTVNSTVSIIISCDERHFCLTHLHLVS